LTFRAGLRSMELVQTVGQSVIFTKCVALESAVLLGAASEASRDKPVAGEQEFKRLSVKTGRRQTRTTKI